MRNQTLLVFALLTPFASLPGCADNNAHPSSPGSGQASSAGKEALLTQQLKEIDDNPNMSPQAKAAAKANIQQHQNMDLSAKRK